MTAKEYIEKEVGCYLDNLQIKTEEEALDQLIKSHRRLRQWNMEVYGDIRNWSWLKRIIAKKFHFIL